MHEQVLRGTVIRQQGIEVDRQVSIRLIELFKAVERGDGPNRQQKQGWLERTYWMLLISGDPCFITYSSTLPDILDGISYNYLD